MKHTVTVIKLIEYHNPDSNYRQASSTEFLTFLYNQGGTTITVTEEQVKSLLADLGNELVFQVQKHTQLHDELTLDFLREVFQLTGNTYAKDLLDHSHSYD